MFVFLMQGLLELTAVEHSQASLMLQTYTTAGPSCAEILLNTSATDRFILKTCLIIMQDLCFKQILLLVSKQLHDLTSKGAKTIKAIIIKAV